MKSIQEIFAVFYDKYLKKIDKRNQLKKPLLDKDYQYILGYDAAKDDAEIIDIEGRKLKIIKPYWLALLKLQAYSGDITRSKDLDDFYFLVDHYLDCIDTDSKLYNANATDMDILDMHDFDTRVAAAIIMKRDCLYSNADIAATIMNNLKEFNSKDELTIALSVAVKIPADLAKRILSNMINITEH